MDFWGDLLGSPGITISGYPCKSPQICRNLQPGGGKGSQRGVDKKNSTPSRLCTTEQSGLYGVWGCTEAVRGCMEAVRVCTGQFGVVPIRSLPKPSTSLPCTGLFILQKQKWQKQNDLIFKNIAKWEIATPRYSQHVLYGESLLFQIFLSQ